VFIRFHPRAFDKFLQLVPSQTWVSAKTHKHKPAAPQALSRAKHGIKLIFRAWTRGRPCQTWSQNPLDKTPYAACGKVERSKTAQY
jgi:hypothetical protein